VGKGLTSRSVLSCAPLYLIGTRPVMDLGRETYMYNKSQYRFSVTVKH
jgi:hypothetical protein